MDQCLFCKIVNKDIPSEIIFEDDLSLAFMDAYPVVEGHLLIIPKNHHPTFHDIPDDELSRIMRNLKTIANAVGADNYNILQNNGRKAGQTVFHAHFHLIPRDSDKVGFNYTFEALKNTDQKGAAERIRRNL